MSAPATAKTSITQRIDGYQPSKTILVWACLLTAAATMIVGFTWGGWVTGGTARAASVSAGDTARGELASAICVERFNAAPDAEAKRAELKGLANSYNQRQFVEAGGWAVMPGQTAPDRNAVQGCATALAA